MYRTPFVNQWETFRSGDQNRNLFVILSWRYDKQVSIEWNFLKPDWYLYRALLSDGKFIVSSWIIRSIILEICGSSEMVLKFFWSVLRPFLYNGVIFATLHLSGKEASLMERSEILAIGVKRIFESFLRNLPARLSAPVTLLVLNSFNIFRIDTELTFSNLSFFFTEVNFLVILVHWSYSKFSSRVRKILKKITYKIRKMFFKTICDCSGRKRQLFFRIEAYACCGSLFVW